MIAKTVLLAIVMASVAVNAGLVHKGGFWQHRDKASGIWNDIQIPQVRDRVAAGATKQMNPMHGNQFIGTMLARNISHGLIAGQEVRTVITTAFLPKLTAFNPQPLPNNNVLFHGRFSIFKIRNYTMFPAFNISGVSNVRVRVISAYASRTAVNGRPNSCSRSTHDVWSEFWGMGPRNRAFGAQMVYSGYVTFTVPPFHFRLCIKDNSGHNVTYRNYDQGQEKGWKEFMNWEQAMTVFKFREPVFIWDAPTTLYADDYAAISIDANTNDKALENVDGFYWNPNRYSLVDNIKLVPFGFPCTYETPGNWYGVKTERNTAPTHRQYYCGSNLVDAAGLWMHSTCRNEGAVNEGVLTTGSNRQNPASTTTTPSGYITGSSWFRLTEGLVGYGKLPAAGQYDVCVSTRSFRASQWNASVAHYRANKTFGLSAGEYVRDGHPVWFKAYAASSSSCSTIGTATLRLPGCIPRKTALVTTTNPKTAITWSMSDMTHSTWGEIKFTGTGTLDYTPATAWDHSATREYEILAGGDQFRIVPEQYFAAVTQTVPGELYLNARRQRLTKTIVTAEGEVSGVETTASVNRIGATYTTGTLTTSGEHKFTQYHFGDPGLGTVASPGCWWGGYDNYGGTGDFGSSTQCCTTAPCTTTNFCSRTDSALAGANAAGDLGGNPRSPYSPWTLDSTGTNSWGYIRVPPGGKFRVCYREPSGNWRVITKTSATSNHTFEPVKKNAGYRYHLNDSRAETWAPFAIESLAGNTLNKQDWNFYADTTSTVVGAAFKIVLSTQSCYVSTAQTYAQSWAPGSLEAANGLGSADDSTTLTRYIYFYARVPSYSTTNKYRICFRKGEDNWHHLSDPNYEAHTYMTAADAFAPLPKPMVAFTLSDNAEGTWGQFIFMRDSSYTGTTQPLNSQTSIGDKVRIVANETANRVPVFCDEVFGSVASTNLVKTAQAVHTYTSSDLGLFCAASSGTSTNPCFTGKLTPTAGAGAVNGYAPYTNLDPYSSSLNIASTDGTIGFITVPPRVSGTRPLGYRVCYKQAHTPNWIEATSSTFGQMLTVTTGPTYAFASQSTGISGAYGYVQITGSTANSISWSTDIAKLVPSSRTCEFTASGTTAYNQEYVSLTSGNADTLAVFVDATNATQIAGSKGVAGTTAVARAYWVWPAPAGSRTRTTTTYRLCYMRRTTSTTKTQNWHSLSTAISVTHYGVVFTLQQDPLVFATVRVQFLSNSGTPLNTNPSRDAAKIVQTGYACKGGETFTMPTITTPTAVTMLNSAEYAEVTDLGTGDEAATVRATMTTVIPSSSRYKVCYKLFGDVYFEVQQAAAVDRIVSMSTSDIVPKSGAITSYTMGTSMRGQTTFSANYVSGQAYSNLIVGGAASRGSGYFAVTLSTADTVARNDMIKLVRTHVEAPAGTYTALHGADCFSDGLLARSVTTTASSTTVAVYMNMPLESGRYLVCYQKFGNSIWYQVPASATYGSSTDLPTFTVIPNELGFAATAATAPAFTVYDYLTNGTNSYGAIVAADTIYIINSTDTCGVSNSYNGVTTVANAQVPLNATLSTLTLSANATDAVAMRTTGVTVSVPTSGFYQVCYYRSQASYTNISSTYTGPAPFTRVQYYHIANVGTLSGGGTEYYAPSGATAVKADCGIFNASFKLRSGRTYTVTATTVDASGKTVNFSPDDFAREIVATPTNTHSLQNYGPGCLAANAATFGYTARNLNQFAYSGVAEYKMTIESGCPSGGCTFNFASTGLTSSATCRVDVFPTTIASIKIVSVPTSCNIGAACTIRAAAMAADGEIAYTATDSATLAITGAAGYSTSGTTTANFASGYVSFSVVFSASVEASILATSTVSVTVTANSQTSSASTFSIYKPVLSAFHIVDIYPSVVAGMDIDPFLPDFEPTTVTSGYSFFHGGILSNVDGSAAITAMSGYHMVAGQFYTVQMRAVGTTSTSVNSYITTSNLMPSTTITVTSNIGTGNSLLNGAACTAPGCTSTLSTVVSGTNPTPWMNFAFRNAKGCTKASPCTLTFSFSSITAVTSTITTPVRAVARRLKWVCGADSSTASLTTATIAAASATSCPSSTVAAGWFVQVTAVDHNGDTDEFFDGQALAVFSKGGMSNGMGHVLTTVDRLQMGFSNATATTATFSSGVALFRRLTLNRPCAAGMCTVDIVSNWGANIASLGSLVATANTAKLACSLNKVLGYCTTDSSSNCQTFGGVSNAYTVNSNSLIYKDTQICMNVSAVDSTNMETLYETNWVHYWAVDQATSGAVALTLTDDQSQTSQVRRYRKMVNGYVNFCFKVGGTFTSRVNFKIFFRAQRFSDTNYWALGSTGECSVGNLAVWPRKLIADVKLTSATGVTAITTGTASVLAAERTSASSLAVGLRFSPYDHYGNVIATTELNSYHQFFTIKPVLDSASTYVLMTNAGSVALRGQLNATVDATATQANVSSAVSYTLNVLKYCLGCTATFKVLDNSGTALTIGTLASPTVAVEAAATVRFFVLNSESTVSRMVAFKPGTSPLTSYWVNGTASFSTLAVSSPPVLHMTSCYASSCLPKTTSMAIPRCDARGAATVIGRSTTAGIALQVFVAESTAARTTVLEPPGTFYGDVGTHLDILNSYTVSITIGSQLLYCVSPGSSCTRDGTTAPSQTVSAYGSSLAAAVTAFQAVTDSASASTNFAVTGGSSSDFSALNYDDTLKNVAPSMAGVFSASATHASLTVNSLSTTGRVFAWRPPTNPVKLVVLSTAADQDECNPTLYSCYNTVTSSNPCFFNGSAATGSVTNMAFSYTAQHIPVGVAFPISAEVQDAAGKRVQTASGTVTVTTDSWSGCNNGGDATFTGTLTNGRVTIIATFAKPCQACVLQFMLTPSTAQTTLYTSMSANPASFFAYTSPVTITGVAATASHVAITSTTPATLLQQASHTGLTVATSFTLNLAVRGNVGSIPVTASAAAAAVVYNRVNTASMNLWWFANGGIARGNAGSSLRVHGSASASFTGTGSVSWMFTKTCTACTVVLATQITGMSAVYRLLGTSFTVTTAQTQKSWFGFVPKMVLKGQPIAVSLVHTGSEASSVPVAGIASTAATSASTVQKSIVDQSNGNGGILTAHSWIIGSSEVHRVSLSSPCDNCSLAFGSSNTIYVTAHTAATHIRPIYALQGMESTVVAVGGSATWTLRAVDDMGAYDVTFGANSCNYGGEPWWCPTTAASVSTALSFNGTVAGAFPQTTGTFLFAATTALTTTSGSITHGRGSTTVTVVSPVRYAIPIFTAAYTSTGMPTAVARTITSASAGAQGVTLPYLTASVGTTGLTMNAIAVSDVTKVSTDQPFIVDVALVGAMTGDSVPTNRYVAADADNTVVMSFAGCPTVSSSTTAQLVRGYVRASIVFTGAAATGCAVTFTAGAGTGRCTTCSAVVSGITVTQVVASRWAFIRPSTWDNGVGSSAGLFHGAAGRSTYIAVALFGADASGNFVRVSSCVGCTMTVTMSGTATGVYGNCGFRPSAGASATFSSTGIASASITWNDAGVSSYLCSMRTTVTNAAGTDLVELTTGTASTAKDVNICRPSQVIMLTNTSRAYRGMFLRTGVAYPFYAIVATSTGAQCRGDSQDDATQLTIEAVTTGAIPIASTSVQIVNVNRTATDSTGYANDWMGPFSNTVRAVGGAFQFQIMFTNSTVALGLSGIRVRVTAASAVPAISAPSNVALSGAVETVIAASALRFHPRTSIPQYVVTGRSMNTDMMNNMTKRTALVVQAVDALNPAWSTIFSSLMNAPNVARRSTEYGNNVAVEWSIMPRTATGVVPFTFGTGAASATLANGEFMWDNVAYTGVDGMYTAVVGTTSADPSISSASAMFMAQLPTALRLNTTAYSTSASCTANCDLPNTTFTRSQNATVNGGAQYLAGNSLTPFRLDVFVSDSMGRPVMGDEESVIAVTLNANSATNLRMGVPDGYTASGTVYAKVRMGRAMFNLGFLGSTISNATSRTHSLASLTISCPATIPMEMRLPGQAAANPCTLSSFSSMNILINDIRASAAVFNDPSVAAVIRTIKFRATVTDVAQFNVTRFHQVLAGALNRRGFTYVTPMNAMRVGRTIGCGVTAGFLPVNDLGSTVCNGVCDIASGAANCPSAVRGCICPRAAARTSVLNRYLLQATANVSSAAIELTYDLQQAEGFRGTNVATIRAGYEAIQAETLTVLQGTEFAQFNLDISAISTRPINDPLNLPTPEPTPQPQTPAPNNGGPSTPGPATVGSGASSVSMLASLLLAALLALLF